MSQQQPEQGYELVPERALCDPEPRMVCVRRVCSCRRRTEDGKVEVRGD